MKRILVCFVFLLFSLFMVNADATYYVSVNGDNSNNGTSPSTPLKTLEEAWSKSAASSGNYN